MSRPLLSNVLKQVVEVKAVLCSCVACTDVGAAQEVGALGGMHYPSHHLCR